MSLPLPSARAGYRSTTTSRLSPVRARSRDSDHAQPSSGSVTTRLCPSRTVMTRLRRPGLRCLGLVITADPLRRSGSSSSNTSIATCGGHRFRLSVAAHPEGDDQTLSAGRCRTGIAPALTLQVIEGPCAPKENEFKSEPELGGGPCKPKGARIARAPASNSCLAPDLSSITTL